MSAPVLDREEYVEQAYFFRIFRDRMAENMPAQEVLSHVHQEILSTTRLPMAVEFLATDIKHTGLLASGFERLTHYFSPFQAFVVRQAEEDKIKLSMDTAMLILEREAAYRAGQPTKPGLFVYQFEAICRNRMGYFDGLTAMTKETFFDADWKGYLDTIRKALGTVDFADLIFFRSETAVNDMRRRDPKFVPNVPALFGDKEGRIAKASHGRDPLYFFAAMQRQLGYPEVPRPRARDETATKMEMMTTKVREMEARLRLLESEARGGPIDWNKIAKPDLLKDEGEA